MATRKASKVSKTRNAKTTKRSVPAAKVAAKAGAKAPASSPKRRAKPETLRLSTITPSLTVNDIARSIAFYTDLLGCVVSERWKGDDGVLRGVMLTAGVCTIGLAQDDWAKGKGRKKGDAFRLWCKTRQDIDVIAARIKAKGGSLTEEPHDQPWGGRSLSLDDPDGFHLTIHRDK